MIVKIVVYFIKIANGNLKKLVAYNIGKQKSNDEDNVIQVNHIQYLQNLIKCKFLKLFVNKFKSNILK